MAETLTCPNCQHRFRLPPEHSGAKIPCPRCEHLLAVPGARATTEEVTREKPMARQAGDRMEVEKVVEVEPDEDAPPIRKRGFEPCPRCGAEDPKRVPFTFWGSFYFTALLNHVRCRQCRYAYNGRTGRSNLPWAIVCVTIPGLLIVAVLVALGYVVYTRMF